jgi:hypothetical protein
VIIAVICIKKRNEKNASSAFYTPLAETSSSASYAAAPAAASARASTPLSGHVSMRLTNDVLDSGEGILQAKKGQIAFVSPEDMAETTDWVWVMVGSQQGYVPRLFLAKP